MRKPMEMTAMLVWLVGVVSCFAGIFIGYLLWGPDREKPKQPEWRKDTVDGAIEWALAALDARKEKL